MFNRTLIILALSSAAITSLAAVPGEVIVAYQAYVGWAVISPDGSNLSYVRCGGDLTRGGAPRYFITTVDGGNPLPQQYFNYWTTPPNNNELVAINEECGEPAVLSNTGNMHFYLASWSPDGNMIAVYAEEFDLAAGTMTGYGIYLGDVAYTGDRPTGVTNLRLVVPGSGATTPDWSPDSGLIVYVNSGSYGSDLFVYTLATGASTNITNTSGRSENNPEWSSSHRIAYQRPTGMTGTITKVDILTIPEAGGTEFRVTSKAKTGSPTNELPTYSPDGQYIAFAACSGYVGDCALYRIRADGVGKAIKIAGGTNQNWRPHYWRR